MASKYLFVTLDDIKKMTLLDGNVDNDKLIQFIAIAHDIHIQGYLGTDLYNKIKTDIAGASLSGNYLALVNNYLKDMCIHWGLVEYIPFAAYNIANKGVYKSTAENAESVSKEEIDYLVEKQKNIAEHYTQRFLDYICNNSSLFPEYNSNSNGDMNPNKGNYYGGWVL